jgi:hypothetical protein
VDGKGERGRYTRKYSEKVGGVGGEGEGEGEVYFYISEFVSVCAGAIGGFVIVGQMLKDYGSCISFSNIINPKLKSQLLYCVGETCSTKLIMTTGYISQECKPCKQIVAKKRRIRKLDGNVRCWCVELLSPLE